MTIRINQIAVDFTLEKEMTFADLTASLRAWANGQNLAILGILADHRAMGPEDPTPLDRIGEVEVEAVPVGEGDLARVAVIARFFALLAEGWERQDQNLVAELHQEFAAVREALPTILSPVLARLASALKVLDGPWTDADDLKAASLRIAKEAEARRLELQHPREALADTLDTLDFGLVSLEALAGLFQKGLDRSGFDLILHLFTAFEDLERRAALVRRETAVDPEWTRFHTELRPLLKEAEGALASGDYILLTDLLEYEVTPRLKAVRGLFPEILNLDPVPDVL